MGRVPRFYSHDYEAVIDSLFSARDAQRLADDTRIFDRHRHVFGAMHTAAGIDPHPTAPKGRECAECDTVLSIYNLGDRCSLHRSYRDADRRWLGAADAVVVGDVPEVPEDD